MSTMMRNQGEGHKKVRGFFDVDWEQAERHRKASKVGFHTNMGDKLCHCCFEQINKQEIPLNQNTKQLQFLGFGFPLYYAFVRNCIFLLLVTICSYNIISLHQAVVSNKEFCFGENSLSEVEGTHGPHGIHGAVHEDLGGMKGLRHFSGNHKIQCTSWMVDIARVETTVRFDEMLIRGVSFVLHLLILLYIRDKLIKLKQYFDERTISPDYSILIKNIPTSDDPNRNLRAQITARLRQDFQNDKIQQIILIPDLKEYEELEEEKKQLIQDMRKKMKKMKDGDGGHGNDGHGEIGELEQKCEQCQKNIHDFVRRNKTLNNQNRLQADRAIIILQTQQDKSQILQNYQQQGFKPAEWKQVQMQEAPQPKQFIWQNISLSTSKHTLLLILGWVLSILVLVVLTVLFAFVSKEKSHIVEAEMHQYKETHQRWFKIEAVAVVFVMIFFVVMFNKIVIANLFHKFTDLQRHSTTYKFQFSFCLKYCLGLFFTTALMTLIVQAFLLNNYYRHDFGVIEQQTIMYIVNSIFVPIFWAINPIYLYKKCTASRHYGQKWYTQEEANHMVEYPEYDVGKRYGEVLEIIWFTFLYMTLIPVGGLISCLGLGLYYWIDKYNLLRRSTIRSYVSGQLIHLTLNMLDFTLVLRVVGSIIFDTQIRDGAKTQSYICLGIAIIYMFLPKQSIIAFFNHQKFNSEEMTYQQACTKFTESYYNQHVLYSYLREDREEIARKLVEKLVRQVERVRTN